MMKQFMLALVAAFLLTGCQQTPDGYVINGEVNGLNEGKIYLRSFRNKMFFDYDSAEIKDGKFTFTGKVDLPLLFGIATESMRYPRQFFVENATMDLKMSPDGKEFSILNSPENTVFLGNEAKIHTPAFSIDSLVRQYPSSAAAAFYLYRYFTYQLSFDELKATRSRLDPLLASSPYVTDLDLIIVQLENVQIGKKAPEFMLPDTAGVNVSLTDFRGKYVLLDFWAAWCPPCRRENPNVVAAYNAYKDKGFTIVGVSLDYDRAAWLKGIADDKLTWTHVSDLKYWDSEIPALYGVRGIPANYLLDPDGVIIAKNIVGETLHETLAKYMK